MSFSMKQLKPAKKSIKDEMSEFSKVINYRYNLTPNVKFVLWEYVKFRLFKVRHSSFTPNKYNEMINDLMEHIIHKDINKITQQDVYINENEFINEVINAIYYCNIHNLYYDIDLKQQVEKRLQNKPKQFKKEEKIEKNDLEEYFRSIMV